MDGDFFVLIDKLVPVFHTIIAAFAAISASFITGRAMHKSANTQIEKENDRARNIEKRKLKYFASLISHNLMSIHIQKREIDGIIRAHNNSNIALSENTKNQVKISLHPILDDWNAMSLLPDDVLWRINSIRFQIERYNKKNRSHSNYWPRSAACIGKSDNRYSE